MDVILNKKCLVSSDCTEVFYGEVVYIDNDSILLKNTCAIKALTQSFRSKIKCPAEFPLNNVAAFGMKSEDFIMTSWLRFRVVRSYKQVLTVTDVCASSIEKFQLEGRTTLHVF